MEVNEQQIIINCQQGNLEEFSRLYDKYIKKIYNFVYYRTHHKETAEDLTSQTFTKCLENLNKFSDKKGTFSSWLYQIARNTVIDYYRTFKKETDIDDVWDLQTDDDAPRDVDTKMKLEKIAEYLKLLDKEQRDLIIMRIWDGLSYKEIAAIAKKSEASLKMMFSRTIKRLKEKDALALILLLLLIE
ncbi:sigma-70 family RNA polymerase sigma factor [Patescibacteria group bacterium]|nr:sigma-70 family RNA polymerase sigma factor [Patescibacteria group bacterium]